MQKSFKLYNKEIAIYFHKATVIHAAKFSEAQGGAFNLPVVSTLHSDIVFRLADFNEDCKVYTSGLDLPIYNDQDVTVISAGEKVVGYIDNQTNCYYYTTRDFADKVGFTIPYYWFIIIAIVSCIITYFINGQRLDAFMFLPLIMVYLLYIINKWYLNHKVKRALDKCLKA